jgi:hypothetical protein
MWNAPLLTLRRAIVLAIVTLAIMIGPRSTLAHADSGDAKRAAIIVKALSFDLEAKIGDALVIAVVYKPGDAASEAVAASWMTSFGQLGNIRVKDAPVRAIQVPADAAAIEAAVQKQGVDALLVSDGLDGELEMLSRVAQQRRLVTIGAKRAYLDRGIVLGVFLEQDKPKIVVNLTAARAANIHFSSLMLKLATVLR